VCHSFACLLFVCLFCFVFALYARKLYIQREKERKKERERERERIEYHVAVGSIVEYMVHPGYKGNSWDEFNCSEDREHELQLLTSSQLKQFLADHNIQLCTMQAICNI